MCTPTTIAAGSKADLHTDLARQRRALHTGERDWLANLANTAALVWGNLPDLNWVGFYLWRSGELVLGPFQGKPACVRIAAGRGVCGTAVAERRSQVVADVDPFPGHIACDAASRSELVVPLLRDGEILGVLDLDSPQPGRFDEEDRAGCEALVATLLETTDFSSLPS